ncbi:MAG: hypothetical protein OXF02_00760 [Simkaniaceae bacterium]|nr:hypothetical protein [Simkaniaceae bacterium]
MERKYPKREVLFKRRIRSAHPLRPFSHIPGDRCMIPGSIFRLTAHPVRFEIADIRGRGTPILFLLRMTGPVGGYTLMQEIEEESVLVYGSAKEGYFAFRIAVRGGALLLIVDRCPEEGLPFSFPDAEVRLRRKERYALKELPPSVKEGAFTEREKLDFGCYKKQDWSFVRRRLLLREILPFWFALGVRSPPVSPHYSGTASLLAELREEVGNRERERIAGTFLRLFSAGFGGMLVPRLHDDTYQGIVSTTEMLPDPSPEVLLTTGAELMRSLFISSHDRILSLLPSLPVALHAGSLVNVRIADELVVDMRWSKKRLRLLVIRALKSGSWQFDLPRPCSRFRMNGVDRKGGEPLLLEAGVRYFSDRFFP